MKQHIFSKGGLLLAFLSVFLSFFACRQDLQEPTNQSQATNGTKIQAAKVWLDNYQKSGGVEATSQFKKMEPQWSEAIAVGNAVEVPIKVNGDFNVPSLYNDLTHLGKQRLVIYDKGSKGKVAYVLDYMPSDAFSSKIEEVNPMNLEDKKFDGNLVVHTLNDKKVLRFVWEKGKMSRKFETKTGSVNLRSCTISTYLWACGRVNGGELECSVGFIITCWNDEEMQDGDWCMMDPLCNGSGGGGGNNGSGSDPCSGFNPPSYCSTLIEVNSMCTRALLDGMEGRLIARYTWNNNTSTDPLDFQVQCHGFAATFRDLQTTGLSPNLNIPLFEIDIYCPVGRAMDTIAISDRIAKAYNITNRNTGYAANQLSGTLPSDAFMKAWANEFNGIIGGSSSNGLYRMKGTTTGTVNNALPTNYHGTRVRDASDCH